MSPATESESGLRILGGSVHAGDPRAGDPVSQAYYIHVIYVYLYNNMYIQAIPGLVNLLRNGTPAAKEQARKTPLPPRVRAHTHDQPRTPLAQSAPPRPLSVPACLRACGRVRARDAIGTRPTPCACGPAWP